MIRFFNFFLDHMVQKYQNEIPPIFYYGISTKTNEKYLKIPILHKNWLKKSLLNVPVVLTQIIKWLTSNSINSWKLKQCLYGCDFTTPRKSASVHCEISRVPLTALLGLWCSFLVISRHDDDESWGWEWSTERGQHRSLYRDIGGTQSV